MTPRKPRPARQSGRHRVRAESRGYLQHADGSWSVVGADGWPVDMDDDLAQLDTNLDSFAPQCVTVVDVEPLSVRDIPQQMELPE